MRDCLTANALLGGETLDNLAERLSLKVAEHSSLPLVILNYTIQSPKLDPIALECRGLCLEKGTWKVVARAFDRFFNYGEATELTEGFDWGDFVAEEKADGSLCLLYNYDGQWHVNTRGSFAEGQTQPNGPTWEQLFWMGMPGKAELRGLRPECTYVFELCSPYNKVVKQFSEPTLYLLTSSEAEHIYSNRSPSAWELEYARDMLDMTANRLGVKRPALHKIDSPQDALMKLEAEAGDFEGYVLRDRTGLRLKVKNAKYVALHHLKGNNNLFAVDKLLPYILNEEDAGELLAYYPEVREKLFDLQSQLFSAATTLNDIYYSLCHRPTQKESFRRRGEGGGWSRRNQTSRPTR